jgi:hypothetical protein
MGLQEGDSTLIGPADGAHVGDAHGISMKGFPHSTKKLSSRRSRLLFSFRAFLCPCTGPGWPLGGPYIHLSWQARSTSFDLRHMISSGAGGPITSLASQASIASGL